jgi:hypothetical protein
MSPGRITQSTLRSCLILWVVQLAACAANEPWPPTGTVDTTAMALPPKGFPELTRPATIYLSPDTTFVSRYVFYEDGTFALQA